MTVLYGARARLFVDGHEVKGLMSISWTQPDRFYKLAAMTCADCGVAAKERMLGTSGYPPYQEVCAPCEIERGKKNPVRAMDAQIPLVRACGHAEWFVRNGLLDEHQQDQQQVRFERSKCSKCDPGDLARQVEADGNARVEPANP